jgi:hypothetical protein
MDKETRMRDEIKTIMDEELKAQGTPSLRKFAEYLMESMAKDGDSKVSHATIINWKNGKPPATDFLEDMLSVYPASDRRFYFALRMLAAKSPLIWGDDGIVWSLKARFPKVE